MNDEITRLSLVEVATEIRSGRVSSREVTEAALARIERLQPALDCFISLDAEGALAEAGRADEDQAKGRIRGPLHGVPLAHKDMFYRTGRVATGGSKIRRRFVADRTATVMARLDAAGAIYLGGLNMAEFAAWSTGYNPTFGTCRNPWDRERITGGSSSGSAAAVAARMVFGALGSDTGGSIRNPAGFCGVVGLKPTYGRVSRHGAMALSWSLDHVGPLARTVSDAARLTAVIAGADPDDPTSSAEPVPDYEAELGRGVEGLRLGVPERHYHERATPEVRALLESSLKTFESLGMRLVPVEAPDPAPIFDVSSAVQRAETATLHRDWYATRKDDYFEQVRMRIEPGFFVPSVRYIQAQAMRGRLVADFVHRAFGQCDLLHLPLATRPTPRNAEFEGDPAEAARLAAQLTDLTRPHNYLGLPVLALPVGFLAGGLPLGCQLVGRPFAEAALFRAGFAYQQATDWHLRRPADPV
ncbi:MAG: Asp-tRNA(Asn)/Glu-tRNA(Gln) amidotransferase subunit GatA [Proteobacteria bacterium]|nr:Asp-tRNA(Asn)/Glu-tRNA(Gln) amidotransferase subunit GatA [Pseudomonadota bacterium]